MRAIESRSRKKATKADTCSQNDREKADTKKYMQQVENECGMYTLEGN